MHHHIVGAIRIQGVSLPVIDEQILAGGQPRAITNESCIVLKNADESLSNFDTAVIVDDVSEMLSIAGNVSQRN
jgi:chemotaxis signal transduction protein